MATINFLDFFVLVLFEHFLSRLFYHLNFCAELAYALSILIEF